MASFAVAAIAKNEAPYVEEWAAFHLLAGAASVRVYDNGSTDGTADALRRLGRSAPVEVVDWPVRNNDFNGTQKAAYQDAAERCRGAVDFVALIDVDEFLCADGGPDVRGALDGFGPAVGAVACQQVLFGSSGAEAARDEPVIARFTRSAPGDYPGHRWFKTIARPDLLLSIETVHSVRTSGRYVFADGRPLDRPEGNPRMATLVSHRPIRLHHYIVKSREEFGRKQARMLAADLPDSVRQGYSDAVAGFDARDRNINAVENLDLARHADAVRRRVERLRAAAAT
jgi:glycosyltransferase involved in cell wall biosynthesis